LNGNLTRGVGIGGGRGGGGGGGGRDFAPTGGTGAGTPTGMADLGP